MDDEELVRAVYPEAVAFQWTGYWRIYKSSRVTDDSEIISDPYQECADAWADAASKVKGTV